MITPIPTKLTAITLGLVLIISACSASRATKGGVIGAAGGGAIGGMIGSQYDRTVLGAIIGAAVGGTAGALIGRHMDKQAEELRRDLEGATVERVGEGMKTTFDSGLLFAVDKSELSATSRQNLTDLAATLTKYPDTEVLIEGHTDADGSDEYNRSLSKQRAESVAAYLTGQGLKGSRITTMGYGEEQPVADNATTDGKAQNRRVDVAIYANERMKKAAERGDLE